MASKWLLQLALPAVVVGCVASSAKADIVVTFTGTAPSQQINVSTTRTTPTGPDTRAFESPVGPFNFNVVSNDTTLNLGSSFRSFCADFFQDVSPGNNYSFAPVAVSDLPDVAGNATKLSKIQELYDRFYDVATDAERGAAFQLALWEILYDPDNTNLASGNFTAIGPGDPSSVGIAQGWLNTIGDGSIPDPDKKWDLIGLYSPTAQDQIVPQQPIPAPAGVVLLVIGAAGLIARRRLAGKKAEATEEPAVETTDEAKA
jgi:hypothetical protein